VVPESADSNLNWRYQEHPLSAISNEKAEGLMIYPYKWTVPTFHLAFWIS
jgi:hypothetical protein